MPVIHPRGLENDLRSALTHSPVVLIHGPRQSGKTTLARFVGGVDQDAEFNRNVGESDASRQLRYKYYNLETDVFRNRARDDPAGFVADLPEKVILDEVQYVPEIYDAIKIEVDRNRATGRFLLTASADISLLPQLANSLVGRMRILRVYSLSQRELANKAAIPGRNFIQQAFGGGFKLNTVPRLGNELRELVCIDGYPSVFQLPTVTERFAWYRGYIETLVERDLPRLVKIRSPQSLKDLLALTASTTSQLFNLETLCAPFELSRPTIRDYVYLLERIFLVYRIPAWHNNQMSRLIKKPKLHLMDTGIGSALLDIDAEDFQKDRPMFGNFLESFVLQELRKQAEWGERRMEFYHFRHKDDYEVDIVMEQRRNTIVGIKVKASATVRSSDFRGLRKLAQIAGDRFVRGIVLYDGEICASFGNNMWAVPMRYLWEF